MYTDPDLVAGHLRRTLDASERIRVVELAQAATEQIDAYCGRSWQGVATLDEAHVLGSLHHVLLVRRPVTAITRVRARTTAVGAPLSTLVAGVDYELIDARRGLVVVSEAWRDMVLLVDYTHPSTVPARVREAANVIVAAGLATGATDDAGNPLRTIRVGQTTFTYADRERESGQNSGPSAEMPARARELLRGLRAVVLA
jgi:hypothetical protein